MANFKAAMEQVYGPFNETLDTISDWQAPALHPKSSRYLWTDAFAVINFITLSKLATSVPEADLWKRRAERLIQSVHDTLGRSRDGSRRLKGATEEEPLLGGLRIGKEDEQGPDQDGQYHHYLTWGIPMLFDDYRICADTDISRRTAFGCSLSIDTRYMLEIRLTTTLQSSWRKQYIHTL